MHKKILAVMQDVEYLQKDDQVTFESKGHKTNYKAISEEKVTSAVGEAMRKHGLVIIPVEQEHFKDGMLTTVNVKYKIVDVDTGEFEYAVSSGTGVDTQDKGVGKAMTYAYKYLLLRTFAIPTGEDPDKVSSAEWDDRQAKDKSSEQPKEPTIATLKAKWKTLAGNLEGFDGWYKKKSAEGWTHQRMNESLTAKLKEKNDAK